jgi:high-affinity iron transporter
MLGLQPVPTVAEVLAWLAYAIPMGAYVLWPQRRDPRSVVVVERSTTVERSTA